MQSIKEYVKEGYKRIKEQLDKTDHKPSLVIIQVGDVEASNRYVKNKINDCNKVGIPVVLNHCEENITQEQLLEIIDGFNKCDKFDGIVVQLPLPKHISEQAVIDAILPEKDVDGFSPLSKVNPATPTGFIDYLEAQGFDFRDKNAVVIGRSNIVGRPAARMLLDRDCNVTVIHSKTSNLNKLNALRYADLIVVATGHRNTLTDSELYMTNGDCIIVDVGINFNEEGKLCGDCENVTIRYKTPVPGGCGLLTRYALITNLLKLKQKNNLIF